MKYEEPLGGFRADLVAILAQDGGEPEGLTRALDGVDLGIPPARIDDDQPHESGSDDEPDDEQPYVELGIHPPEV
jgi:hypothetical protein